MSEELSDREVVQQIFAAKWVCNGFPKSGTHLLATMVRVIAPFQEGTVAGLFKLPWAGTFDDNSWTEKWVNIERTCYKLGRIGNGKSVKAHLGHNEELAHWMKLWGGVHIFIYRDLRDVAVSQAHHIIHSDKEHLSHPRPEAYPRDNFDEVLKLVITGHEEFPGVVARWKHYEPWLHEDWTLSVRFEDLLHYRQEWALEIYKHGMSYNASKWDKTVDYDLEGLQYLIFRMTAASEIKKYSPTFREGKSGGWSKVFNDEHKALWIEHDKVRWLEKLGYEEGGWYEQFG